MTKLSEITAQFKNTKIWYPGVETSAEIQKQLFKMGFRWTGSICGEGREINFPFASGWIFIDNDLRLTWSGVEYSGYYEISHRTLDEGVERFLTEKKDAIKQKRFDKLAYTKFFIGNNKVLFKKVLDHLYPLGFLWQSGGVGKYDYDCEWLCIHSNGKLGFLESGDTGSWPGNWEEYRTGSLQELSINKKFWPGNKVMTTEKGITMYAMKKFKVENVQESEAVQEALYKLGYVWECKIKSLYESLSDVYPAVIFCHKNKTLTFGGLGLDWLGAKILAYKEVDIAELLPKQAKSSEWIEWQGGECPVPTGTVVDVQYRDGDRQYTGPAGVCRPTWGRDASPAFWRDVNGCNDIVRYRLNNSGLWQAEIQFAPAIIEEVIAYPIGRHDYTPDPLAEKLTVHGMFEKMIAEGDAVVEEIAPDVNPKKQFGDKNIPLNLWSSLASSYGALGLYNGKLKYGGGNYKATPVEASIYIAGAMRHLAAWAEGEEFDPVDNVPNLGGVLANIAIILDSRAAGTLIDDRNIPGGYIKERAALQGIVASLQVLHAGKTPRHYTIADAKCNDTIL